MHDKNAFVLLHKKYAQNITNKVLPVNKNRAPKRARFLAFLLKMESTGGELRNQVGAGLHFVQLNLVKHHMAFNQALLYINNALIR